MKYGTMKISEVMKNLEWYLESYGDMPVLIASDEEWNSIGTAGVFDEYHGVLMISPYKDNVDLRDIEFEE